jgi:Outer membrane protein beta-barrel domain
MSNNLEQHIKNEFDGFAPKVPGHVWDNIAKQNIENHVRTQFDGYEPQVPAHIWDNIARENRRRKPVGNWFANNRYRIAAAVAAMLVCSLGVLYFNNNQNELTASGKVEENNVNNNIENVPTTKVIEPDNAVIEQGTNDEIETALDKSPTNKEVNTYNGKPFANKIESSPVATFGLQNRSSKKKKLKSDHSQQVTEAAKSINEFQNTALGKTVLDYAKLPIAASIPANKFRYFEKLHIPCPEDDAAPNKKYIEVYAGADYSFFTTADFDDKYEAMRRESIGTTVGYSAGLRFTKVFGNGVAFKTGVNFSQAKQKFSIANGYSLQNIITVNNAGDTLENFFVQTENKQSSTNTFTSIDIPVLLGYELGNGKLHANLSTGVMLNLRSYHNGFVVDKAGKAVNISSAEEANAYSYKKTAGLSLLGAVAVYYKLNDKVHLMAEPYIRYGLSPITNKQLTISQKMHTTGLRLGVRMDF